MYTIQDIDIDLLRDNPYDRRKKYGDIEGLAESIKERGLQNPISVVKVEEHFVIVSGHRRTHAFRYLKRKKIPAIIRKESTPTDLATDLAIENLQRKDLLPVEKGETIQQLFFTIPNIQNNANRIFTLLGQVKWYGKKDSTGEGFIEEDIINAKRLLNIVGISSTAANRYLRICQLPENIQNNVVSADNASNIPEGKIVTHVAYELTRLKDPNIQTELFERAVKNKMTHGEVKHAIDEIIDKNEIIARNIKNATKSIEGDIDMPKLAKELDTTSLKVGNLRSKLPLLCERFEKLQLKSSLDKMKESCLNLIRNINDLLREDLKIEELLEYANTDLEVKVKKDLRFNFPTKIAETLNIKEGDSLLLKIEGIKRSPNEVINVKV